MSDRKALSEVLAGWIVENVTQLEVSGVCLDSRDVRPGDLYFAYPGARSDGRDYVEQAIGSGAVAIAAEPGRKIEASIPVFMIPQLRDKLGLIAERFYGHPTRDLFIVGITGTNGKTSCAHLLAQAFHDLGLASGLIGTLGFGLIRNLQPSRLTTPDPITLHRRLRALLDAGATHICMEVSSHALSQSRVSGVQFDAAVFTNLSHDHLDYHENLGAYARAKSELFRFPRLQFSIINRDDVLGRELVQTGSAPAWTYGLENENADVRATDVETEVRGVGFTLNTKAGSFPVRAHLVGRLNVHNLLAVAAVLLAQGRELFQIADTLFKLRPVPGRMELFQSGDRSPVVIVDYAHTPDALERALISVREHCTGRLWCVFGCGGDRDRGKRPMMGAIAERLADAVIVTNDNPRHELPQEITDQIVGGMSRTPRVVHDRVEAIKYAISNASHHDWVLVAGKGHEATQQVGDVFHRLDDREVVNRCLGVAA